MVSEEPSKNGKVQILKDNDSLELREILNLAFNPFNIYGLKKVKYDETTHVLYSSKHRDEFVKICEYCINHNTDNNKRQLVTEFLNKCSQPQQNIYADILIKKLRIGGTVSTCNKALGDFIPEFKIMLADSDDNCDLDTRKLIQEKYDGVRCVIFKRNGKCTAFTRQGKPLQLDNIFNCIEKSIWDNIMIDGELTGGNRTETTSITSKLLKGNRDATDAGLKFNTFDIIPSKLFDTKESSGKLFDRITDLERFVMGLDCPLVTFGKCTITNTRQEVMGLYNEVVERGGEGLIVKDLDAPYYFKRNKAWTKLKQINYCTLEVVNIVEGTGKHKGKLGALTCSTSDGIITTNVGTGFSDELRENMWNARDTLIGRFVEIKVNELQYDRDNQPYLFLPVFVETRVDKAEADSFEKIKKEFGN